MIDADTYSILLIDHEPDVERLAKGLRDVPLDVNGSLGDRYTVDCLVVENSRIPPNTPSPDALRDRVAEKLAEKRFDLLLLDRCMCVNHQAMQEGKRFSQSAARELRRATGCAVGMFTTREVTRPERVAVSAQGLSVFLDDIEKLFPHGGTDVDGQWWIDLFKAISSSHDARREASLPPSQAEWMHPEVSWLPDRPHAEGPAFERIIPHLVRGIFSAAETPPESILIEQIGGGFSGSYLLRAKPSGSAKTWALKIDEDPARLTRELKGYKAVEERVLGGYWCGLHPVTSKNPVCLASDWWGAIALAWEPTAEPILMAFSTMAPEDIATIYRRLWDEALLPLYGPRKATDLETVGILDASRLARARRSVHDMRRYEDLFARSMSAGQLDAAARARAFLEEAATALQHPFEQRLNVVVGQRIHGDLNCRNILLDSATGGFRLIDFPNVAPGAIATDYTKAEAEILMVVADWATGEDLNPLRAGPWCDLAEQHSADALVALAKDDDECERAIAAINAIRASYLGVCGQEGIDAASAMAAYRVFLLQQLVGYIAYPDITMPKKMIALCWIGHLTDVHDKGGSG